MENLKVKELIEICEELGITLGRAKRKQAILDIMKDEGVSAEEVDEAWVDIKARREEAERREVEAREREEAERREAREREERREAREREEAERREAREREEAERRERREEAERQERLEMKRIELAILQCSQAPSVASPTIQVSGFRIRDQLPPFVVGEDMAKYLVKFEHVCERNALERPLWARNLLALLPGEVSDAITCLSREAFESYDEVKEVLLRRYKLSPEAFRQRFRYAEKGNESHVDFAFRLKADLIEWLKGEGVYDDRDKVVECVALEQFYRCIEEDVKLWLQDRLGEVQLNKAAELAEEYYTRRKLHSRAVRVEKDERKEGFSRKPDQRKPVPHRNFKKDPSLTKDSVGEGQAEAEKSSEVSTTQAFESENKRKPLICYNCKKEGHIARNCQEKFAFATIRESEKNMRLLEPYLQEIRVNEKTCRALRDSAATMDVVHPSLVSPDDFTGECAWIRQVAEEQSVRLPIATVVIEGPFGKLCTEAAVSAALNGRFSYLFSNNSEQLLKEQGKSFFPNLACMAPTRSQARKLSRKLDLVPCGELSSDLVGGSTEPQKGNFPHESCEQSRERPVAGAAGAVCSGGDDVAPLSQSERDATLSPVAESWSELPRVDRETLIRGQSEDLSIEALVESQIEALVESQKNAAKVLSKEHYEKSGKKRAFEVDNQVMRLQPPKRNKLEVDWEGPVKVLSKPCDTNYEVKLGRRPDKIYNLMKPYVQHQAIVNLLLNASEEEEAESLSSSEVIEGGSKVIREQINLEPSLSEGGPEKEDLRKIGSEFEDVFSDCPGNMRVIEHDIELSGEESISSKPYRCSPVQRRKCEPLLVPHRYRRLKVAGY
ncbi:uncharacterized protein LOC119173629 [Rhipicephalus microplus]|uniref:uncharacterized protein LOC119173629 n=1 Tax=Rhipicephalus microplus TaxID=6941 RepID=UPI003F6D6E6C